MRERLIKRWRQFWLWRGGYDSFGRLSSWLGSLGAGSHRQLHGLVWVAPQRGFISPSARIAGVDLRKGSHVFVGERVVIAQWDESGVSGAQERIRPRKAVVELGNYVQLNRETAIELVDGGSVSIGVQVGIQMRCFFQAAACPIKIGNRAMVAPYCMFLTGEPRTGNPRLADGKGWDIRGPIVVEDDAWLGVGVKVLGGVTIGEGAVVAAGSVVASDIPAGGVAAGNPARLIRQRADLTPGVGESTKDGVSEVR